MKTITIFSFCILVFTLSLSGQSDQDKNLFKRQRKDTILQLPPLNFPQFNIPKKSFDFPKQNFKNGVPEIKRYGNNHLPDRYPGSRKFYGSNSYAIYPYEKSFVKKPDTTVKYYLIIKNPLDYRMIK